MKNESKNNNETKAMPYDTVLCPVIFENREFYGIIEFDCVVVRLYTEKTKSGSFTTNIPISDKEYRRNNPTKAKVEITIFEDWTIFELYSDWGKPSVMKIHNSLESQISNAINSAIDMGLYGA